MGEYIRGRLKQQQFSSPYHEALLSLLVAADAAERRLTTVCEAHGITSAQYNVLRILRGVHPGGHPRCDIIDRMIQQSPDVTRLINRLESSGLAARGKSEDDRRLSLTYITKTGLELLEQMQPAIDEMVTDFSLRITVDEALTLTELCERVAADSPAE